MTTEINGKKLYKVISRDGKSYNGGSHSWNLPSGNEPGEWQSVFGPLRMCQTGFHLTTEPQKWLSSAGFCIYLAEAEDILQDSSGQPVMEEDKLVCRSIRLLWELTEEEYQALQIYHSGKHSVTSGTAYVFDSATVSAYDSAIVSAYGSATVRASGSATVRASDSATVEASDSATVEASDSATVKAYDSATVRAFDSATVLAYGSATVLAYNSATVLAYNSATVRAYGSATVIFPKYAGNQTCTLKDQAVLIDRRGEGKPILSTSE